MNADHTLQLQIAIHPAYLEQGKDLGRRAFGIAYEGEYLSKKVSINGRLAAGFNGTTERIQSWDLSAFYEASFKADSFFKSP